MQERQQKATTAAAAPAPPTAAADSEYRSRQVLERVLLPLTITVVVHVILFVGAVLLMVKRTPGNRQRAVEVRVIELPQPRPKPPPPAPRQPTTTTAQISPPDVPLPELPTGMIAGLQAVPESNGRLELPDSSTSLKDLLSVETADSALELPALYTTRNQEARHAQRREFGGTEETEAAVLRALRWLQRTQRAQGAWSKGQPEAMAGLALLAFLAHGETPASEEFGDTVRRAMEYLTESWNKLDENNPPRDQYWPYRNGIVTYALAEAYGLTRIPFLKAAAEKGLAFIVKGQQSSGGWDYSYNREGRWDLSASSWQVQALKAAQLAELHTERMTECMHAVAEFLKNDAYREDSFAYSSASAGSWAMQGAGALCLQLLGQGRSRAARSAVRELDREYKLVWDPETKYNPETNPSYAWYYITQALFHGGKGPWKRWNQEFAKTLVRNQKPDGHWRCPGKDSRRYEYDPYYTTCMCCLSLEVYYRYLPTYERVKAADDSATAPRLDFDAGTRDVRILN